MAGKGMPVVADLPDAQARAQDQQGVAILHREIAGPVADAPLPAGEVRIVAGEQVMSPGRRHGDAQLVDDALEAIQGMSHSHSGAGKNYRSLSFLKVFDNGLTLHANSG